MHQLPIHLFIIDRLKLFLRLQKETNKDLVINHKVILQSIVDYLFIEKCANFMETFLSTTYFFSTFFQDFG